MANLATRFWDFIDTRDIDKHVISILIGIGTWRLTQWSFDFAWQSTRSGMEVAAIIAAVGAPYMALQAAALKWYFDARSS